MPFENLSLDKFELLFPAGFGQEELARAKTALFKNLSLALHRYYGGKIQTLPRCGIYGLNWFNLWYTPGCRKFPPLSAKTRTPLLSSPAGGTRWR